MDYITGFYLVFLLISTCLIVRSPLLWFMWLSAALFSSWPFIDASLPPPIVFSVNAEQKQILMLIALFSLLLLKKVQTKKIEVFLGYLGIVSVAATIIAIPFHDPFISGLVPNKSMNGILNCMLLPYICKPNYRAVLPAVILVAFLTLTSSSSCAFAAFSAMCAVWVYKTYRPKFLILVLAAASLSLAFGLLFIPDLFALEAGNGTRWEGYHFFFKNFRFWDWMFGYGPGSFMARSIWMQKLYHFHYIIGVDGREVQRNWLYFHSDPLQFIFEYGIVGIPTLALAAWKVWKNAPLAPLLSIAAMCAGSLFYYPFHWPHHLLVLFLSLKIVANNIESHKGEI